MSDWQLMEREQLEELIRAAGARRGSVQVMSGAEDGVADRICSDVMGRLGEEPAFNVRHKTIKGRLVLDVHVAGEPAGRSERDRYNKLRQTHRSHEEAVETMVGAYGLDPNEITKAVGNGAYTRITVPLLPGGRIYGRSEMLGRRDNPNETMAQLDAEAERAPLQVGDPV